MLQLNDPVLKRDIFKGLVIAGFCFYAFVSIILVESVISLVPFYSGISITPSDISAVVFWYKMLGYGVLCLIPGTALILTGVFYA